MGRTKEGKSSSIKGLNDQYGMILSQILNMEPFPSIKKAYALVTKEEKQLAITSIGRGHSAEATTFVVIPFSYQTGEFAGEQPKENWQGGTNKLKCTYCYKPGHSKDKWLDILYVGKAKQKLQKRMEHVSSNNTIASSSQSSGKGFNLTLEQYEQLLFPVGVV